MREALADDLLPGERGPLHAALARALETDPGLSVSPSGATAELAFHWFAAHNLPAAFSASALAGAEAMRLAAFAEANAHYERAIELWDGVPEDVRAAGPSLVELIRSAAEAAHLAGEDDRAAALTRRALTLVDADRGSDDGRAAQRAPRALPVGQRQLARWPRELPRRRGAAAGRGRPGGPRPRPRLGGPPAHAAGARHRVAPGLRGGARHRAQRRCPPRGGQHPRHHVRGHERRGRARRRESSTARRRCASPRSAATPRRSRGPTSTSARRSTAPGASPRRRSSPATARWSRSSRASARSPPCWPATQRCACSGWGAGTTPILPSREPSTWPWAGCMPPLRWPRAGSSTSCAGASTTSPTPSRRRERAQVNALGSMWTGPATIVAAELALWRGDPLAARDEVEAMLTGVDPADDGPLLPDPGLRGRRAGRGGPGRRRAGDRRRGGRARRLRARRRVRGARAPRRPPGRVPGRPLPARVDAHPGVAEAERARARGSGGTAAWSDLGEDWDAFGMPYAAAYARWRLAEAILPRAARAPTRSPRWPRHTRSPCGCAPARWAPSSRRSRAGRGCRWGRRRARGLRRRRRRGARGTHGARAGGPAPRGQGRDQSLDRPGPLHQREDRQRAHLADPGQARCARPRRGGGPGPAPRPPGRGGPRQLRRARRSAPTPRRAQAPAPWTARGRRSRVSV